MINYIPEIPQKVWVEKLLADKEKAYHIWGKVLDKEELHDFWLPKAAIIKDNSVKDVVIDYSKYSHRPPLEHQKEAIQKLVENKNSSWLMIWVLVKQHQLSSQH